MLAPVTQGLTGMTFLLVAEAGVLINNFSRNVSATIDYIFNAALGYDVGWVGYNPMAEYTIKGRTTGTGGIAGAAPCTALTVANITYGNGVGTMPADAGGVYTQTLGLDHGEKAFQEVNVTAKQSPGIP